MERRQILKNAMFLAVPIMIQNGITNAVSLVDHIMVGSLGTESMTAVSIIGQLLFVFSLAIFGGVSGPGIYAAQFYGQGNTEGVRAATRMKAWISLVCTVCGIAIFIFLETPLIQLYLHGESADINAAETVGFAKEYLRIMLIGIPAMAVTQIYASSLRETGDSVKPMVSGIISVCSDIVLNYLLIYGSFGFPKLGVAGAAIATVIARYIDMTVLIVWSYTRRKKHPFIEGLWKTLKIPKKICKRILMKGIPIFINEFLWASGLAVLTQCYSTRGLEVVAGINISNVLCNLLNVVFVALGYAVGILVGQSLGAGEFDNAKKTSKVLTRFTVMLCMGIALVLIAMSHAFPMIYNTTDEVRSLATRFIIITALFFPVQGALNTLYFTLRSGGKTLVTFLFDSVFSWSVTIPLALVLSLTTDLKVMQIYVIIQATDIVKIILGSIMIKKGIWIKNLAEEIKN